MKDLTWYDYFFTQCRAVWVYLRMFVLPFGLNVDHDFPISRSLMDHGAVFGLIALIAVGVAAWIFRRAYPLASYGYFAFLILLAPTSSVVPIRDVLVERRVYLAFFPLALICCEFLRRIRVAPAPLAAALACVLCVFGFATYQRNEVWSDAISLWKDTAEKSPAKSRPRFQLAYAYYQEGRCAEAIQEYGRAAQLQKPGYDLLVDWGLAYDCAKQPEQALDKFQKAVAMEKSAHAYSLIGMVRIKRNEKQEAIAALDEAEKLDPRFAMTYVYRGNLFLLSQEFEKAAAQFEKAIALNPSDQAARNGLDMAQRRVTPTIQ
jgi:protein O-mannosyl-transferase